MKECNFINDSNDDISLIIAEDYEDLLKEVNEEFEEGLIQFEKSDLGIISTTIKKFLISNMMIENRKEQGLPLSIGIVSKVYIKVLSLGGSRILKDNIKTINQNKINGINKLTNERLQQKINNVDFKFKEQEINYENHLINKKYRKLIEERRNKMLNSANNFQKIYLHFIFSAKSSSMIATMDGNKENGGGIILTLGAILVGSSGTMGFDVLSLIKNKALSSYKIEELEKIVKETETDIKNKKLNELINKTEDDLMIGIEYYKGIFELQLLKEEGVEEEDEEKEVKDTAKSLKMKKIPKNKKSMSLRK